MQRYKLKDNGKSTDFISFHADFAKGEGTTCKTHSLLPVRLFSLPGQGDRRALPMLVFVSPGGRSSPGPSRGRQSPGAVPGSAPSAGTRTTALTSPQQAPRGGRSLMGPARLSPKCSGMMGPSCGWGQKSLGGAEMEGGTRGRRYPKGTGTSNSLPPRPARWFYPRSSLNPGPQWQNFC